MFPFMCFPPVCVCVCVHQQLVSSAREKKPRGRYAKLEEEMERGNQDFIEQQRNQQQVRECLSLCVCVGGVWNIRHR